MHSVFILNSTASIRDLTEASAEYVHHAKTLQSLVLLNCFDESGHVISSSELLTESLWIIASFLNDAEKINDLILCRG